MNVLNSVFQNATIVDMICSKLEMSDCMSLYFAIGDSVIWPWNSSNHINDCYRCKTSFKNVCVYLKLNPGICERMYIKSCMSFAKYKNIEYEKYFKYFGNDMTDDDLKCYVSIYMNIDEKKLNFYFDRIDSFEKDNGRYVYYTRLYEESLCINYKDDVQVIKDRYISELNLIRKKWSIYNSKYNN